MGNSTSKQHFQTASKTGIINLSHHNLKEFPQEMNDLKPILRNLDMSYNKFSKLPNNITSFNKLKTLNFDNNKVEHLPQDIGILDKLEIFSANYNLLTELPLSFSKLINLKQLSLNNNKLNKFPTVLFNLQHLDVIELSDNNIEQIPDGIGKLKCSELNLNKNKINFISNDLSLCSKLKIIKIQENCLELSNIPTSLFSSSSVCYIHLEGNPIDSRALQDVEGYSQYMERYTQAKKKLF